MSEMYRDSIFWVEVERIKPNPFQPRREFDQQKLVELADSIRMYGLLQPLTVTRREEAQEDGGIRVEYELIAGERRLRASRIAGLAQVPVIIRASEDDDKMKFELAIIENLQREDLNPIDRALAFDKLARDFQYSLAEVGRRVGRSREYVSNSVRLLGLPEHIQLHLVRGNLTEGHTRPLLMLNDKPEAQEELLREIVERKMNVRDSEHFARRAAQDKVSKRHKIDPLLIDLEKQLTERLGTRVHIEPREVGGKLVISYFSAADLGTLLTAMQVEQESFLRAAVFNGSAPISKVPSEESLTEGVVEYTNQPQQDPERLEGNDVHVISQTESVAEERKEDSQTEVLPDDHYPLPEHDANTASREESPEAPYGERTNLEGGPQDHSVVQPGTLTESPSQHNPTGLETQHNTPDPDRFEEEYDAQAQSVTTENAPPKQDTNEEDELYSIRNFTV